jgi:flagellar basal-body rod protein FlgB
MSIYNHSEAYSLAGKAMDFRSLRQELISSNLANNMTPYYKARDINFETYLRAEKRVIMDKEPDLELDLALTDGEHMEPETTRLKFAPEIFFRDGHMARNDGNTVDLDIESTEMSKNSVMFNALTNAAKKHSMILKTVIDNSGKL